MPLPVARIAPLVLTPWQYIEQAQTAAFSPAPNLTIARGTVLGQITNAVNDVDTITMAGTGNDWSLTIQNNNGTYTIYDLAYNISTANLQAAIRAMLNIQGANVYVTGTAGTSYVLTATGALAGYQIGIVTVDATNAGGTQAGLSGGGVTVVHTTTDDVAGQVKAYATGNSDGSQNPVGLSLYDFTTDQNGNITLGGAQTDAYGVWTGPGFGIAHGHTMTIPAYINGWFLESDLVGLDSGAITAFFAREFHLPAGAKAIRIP